jgi:hypothetical protein
MRKLLSLVASATLAAGLGLVAPAGAAVVEWEGTMITNMGRMPQFVHQGTGVSTVNGSAGAIGHISSITWNGGLTHTGGNSVPETIPLTGPENPTLISMRMTGMNMGSLSFNGISDGPPLGSKNTGIAGGQMRMCILFPGCGVYLPIPFGRGSDAVGVGGMFTVNTFSKAGGFKMSLQGAPWTIGLASMRNVTTETPNGAVTTYTRTIQGFVHGPASVTSGSSAAAISGVLQIVTPVLVETSLGSPDKWQAVFTQVKLHFIPEPGLLMLLGSGIAGLLLLGRSRMRGS